MATQRDQKPDLASALWPHLSQQAKAEAARQARWQEERKARNRRLADHLREAVDAVRREKAGR
jgi:hypothetical protein